MSNENRIFIVGPAWVGDMVMAHSLFQVLKQEDPDALLDVLAPDWSRPLLRRMPEVHQSHAMTVGHGALNLQERVRIGHSLKPYKYTRAIVMPLSWKSALIPWVAGIPRRTGFWGEFRVGLLNDLRTLDRKKLPQMVERYVALASDEKAPNRPRQIPLPRLRVDPAGVEAVVSRFSLQNQLANPILALCPGAEFGPSKRWPERSYAEVALAKLREGWSVWIFGSKNDVGVAQRVQAETGGKCLDLTGRTTLDEAIDLLSLVSAVVTNDSGLMHIAAALDKPLVAVYGSSDPVHTPPLGEQSTVVRLALPCSPCFKKECPLGHHRCMKDLGSERVSSAVGAPLPRGPVHNVK